MRHLPLMVLLLAACSSKAPPASRLPGDVVATVDGVSITEADVALARAGGHGAGDDGDPVDALIGKELAAQRARALGLDDDPAYQAELHRLEAPVVAFERERLAARFYEHLDADVAIDDATARAYFDANAGRIRTEVRVRQILLRDRAKIDAARAALAAGEPFDQLAGAREVGFVRWNQIPEAWRAPLDALDVGEISDVIAGPRGRFWILQVEERRVDDTLAFDDVEDVLVEQLRADQIAERRATAALELRNHAHVIKR